MASKPPSFTPIFNNFATSLLNQLEGNEEDEFLDDLEFAEREIHARRSSSSATPTLQGRATYPKGSLPPEEDTDDEDNAPSAPDAAPSSSVAPHTPTKPFKSSLLYGSGPSSPSSSETTNEPSSEKTPTKGSQTPAAAGPPESPWSGSKETPIAIRGARHMLGHRDPSGGLIRGDREILQAGLTYLDELPTPERQQRTAEMRNTLTSGLVNQHNARRIQDKALAVRRALCDEEAWVTKALKPLDITLVDRDHLTTFHQGKGKHICPLNDPLQAEIVCRYNNPSNQVWAGTIRREKFSTFIPLNMSEDRYMTLVVQARQNPHQVIAKSGNKELVEIHHNGQRIVVECCLGEEGKIIKTAYPLFHFETYRPLQKNLEVRYGFQYDLNEPRRDGTYQVPYQLILQLIKQKNLLKTCCVYDTADAKIFDIAVLFNNDCQKYGRCPIEQGIYVKIPKKYLN